MQAVVGRPDADHKRIPQHTVHGRPDFTGIIHKLQAIRSRRGRTSRRPAPGKVDRRLEAPLVTQDTVLPGEGPTKVLALAALLLLATPLANAAQVSGELLVQGSVLTPQGANASLRPQAFLVEDTADLSSLDFTGTDLRVCRVEKTLTITPVTEIVHPTPKIACYDLPRATITLLPGDHKGFLGAYQSRSSVLRTTDMSPAAFEPLRNRTIADASVDRSLQPIGDTRDPSYLSYVVHIQGPHVHFTTTSGAVLEGAGALRIQGPDVRVQGPQNVTNEPTGARDADYAVVKERTATWLFITYKSGTLTLGPGAPIEAAGQGIDEITADGLTVIDAPLGTLRTRDAEYAPSGARNETINGRLQLAMHAQDAGRANLIISGDIEATSLRAVPRPAAAPWVVGSDFVVLAVGAVLVAGSGGAVLIGRRAARKQRSTPPPAWPDALKEVYADPIDAEIAAAEALAEDGDFAGACERIASARKANPGDADLAEREAVYARANGDHERALAAYEEVSRLTLTGDADLYAAICSVELERPGEAVAFLKRCLERDPRLCVEIPRMKLLDPVLLHPEVQEALRAARRSLSG